MSFRRKFQRRPGHQVPEDYAQEAERLAESVRAWGADHHGEDLIFLFPKSAVIFGTLDQLPDDCIGSPLTREFVDAMTEKHPEATILMLQAVLEHFGARKLNGGGLA